MKLYTSGLNNMEIELRYSSYNIFTSLKFDNPHLTHEQLEFLENDNDLIVDYVDTESDDNGKFEKVEVYYIYKKVKSENEEPIWFESVRVPVE